jgi:hypothetical protein
VTAIRILASLLGALDLAACGSVTAGSVDAGDGGRIGAPSSSASTGCPVSVVDAGACTNYTACVSATVPGSCKSSYDACYASGGPCAAFIACTAPCNCSDQACVSACGSSMSASCNDCLQTATNCSENACSAQLAQCVVGINDAATHDCVDLAKCCGSLVPSEQGACVETVTVANDTICSTFFATVGCP